MSWLSEDKCQKGKGESWMNRRQRNNSGGSPEFRVGTLVRKGLWGVITGFTVALKGLKWRWRTCAVTASNRRGYSHEDPNRAHTVGLFFNAGLTPLWFSSRLMLQPNEIIISRVVGFFIEPFFPYSINDPVAYLSSHSYTVRGVPPITTILLFVRIRLLIPESNLDIEVAISQLWDPCQLYDVM